MKKSNLINIIKEEISGFDYLNNNAYNKEQKNIDIVKDEDFQKQFICDSILGKKNILKKVSYARIGGDWKEKDDATSLSIDYSLDIEYKYDSNEEPAEFTLKFNSKHIDIEVNEKEKYDKINWNDIEVSLDSQNEDKINFIAFKKAPNKIQNLFIREYLENFIQNETFNTNIKKDNIQSIQYC
jgi:hypothetical protein